MRNQLISLFCILSAGLLFSCKHKQPANLPASEGIPGEIMVVTEEEKLSESEGIFNTAFSHPEPLLVKAENASSGQKENEFSFYFVRDKAYDGTEKQAQTIIVWNDAGKFSKDLDDLKEIKQFKGDGYEWNCYENVWAKPQKVIWIKTDKNESISKPAAMEILLYLQKNEVLPGNLQPNAYCDSVADKIAGSYGFRFQFTPQFRLEFSNYEVVWLRQETARFYRDIWVNIFNDSVPVDSMEQAIANRNYFSKKYLKNEEGTHVLVSRSPFFPLTWKTNANGSVLKGWYEEEGTFRRGPFVRYYFHDRKNHRYVAWDGFVYAPEMKRAMFYRTFEILSGTFRFEP